MSVTLNPGGTERLRGVEKKKDKGQRDKDKAYSDQGSGKEGDEVRGKGQMGAKRMSRNGLLVVFPNPLSDRRRQPVVTLVILPESPFFFRTESLDVFPVSVPKLLLLLGAQRLPAVIVLQDRLLLFRGKCLEPTVAVPEPLLLLSGEGAEAVEVATNRLPSFRGHLPPLSVSPEKRLLLVRIQLVPVLSEIFPAGTGRGDGPHILVGRECL